MRLPSKPKDSVYNTTVCDKLNSVFDENGRYSRPFKGLETQYQQMKYFEDSF